MNFPYDLKEIPEWCQLPISEHKCMGGCWGISHELVKRDGLKHCEGCEFKNKDWKTDE